MALNPQHIGTGRQVSTEQVLGYRRPTVVMAVGLSLLVDGLAAYLFWSADGSLVSLVPGLALHGIASVLFGTVLWRTLGPNGVVGGLVAGIFVLAWVPPVGVILATTYFGWHVFRDPSPQATLALAPTELEEPPPPPYSSDRMALPEPVTAAMEIQPLVDIFQSDDMQLKSSAIDLIIRLEENGLVGVLRGLLTAPEADVRLLAAAGLAKLDKQFNDSIAAGQTDVRLNPSSLEAAQSLGQLYLKYVGSGLLDASISARYADLALREFENCQRLDSSRSMTLERSRCYLNAGDYQACLRTLDSAELTSDETEQAALVKMEAMFALGLYGRLQQEAVVAGARLEFNDDAGHRDIVSWWGAGAS